MLYVFSEAEAWASGAAVALMVMDIVTGFAGSIITRAFQSSKMREGLGHKFLVLSPFCSRSRASTSRACPSRAWPSCRCRST